MLALIFSLPILAICPNCDPFDREIQFDELSDIGYHYVFQTREFGFHFSWWNFREEIYQLKNFSEYQKFFQELIDENEARALHSIKRQKESISELKLILKKESSYKDPDLPYISHLQNRITDHESAIESIASRAKNVTVLLQSGLSAVTARYQQFNEACILKHPCSMAYYQRGMINFEQGNNVEFIDDISKIIEKDEVGNVLKENNKTEFTFYLHVGRNFNEIGAYDQAIEALDKAIKANPQNKNAYFERAVAYFEKGDFDHSLQDYLQSGLKPKPVDLNAHETLEYVTGLIVGTAKGSKEGLVEYIPSMWASAKGLGHGLWAFVCNPSQVSSELVQACKECANFIRESSTNEIVSLLVPELKELIEKKNEISSSREGEIIGYVIGKYGLDIFAGGATVKAVKSLRDLKRANNILTLNLATLNKENQARIALESARRVEARNQILESANIRIKWDEQRKHMKGNMYFDPLRSELTHSDPEMLVKNFAGKGQRINNELPGCPGYKERIDFGEIIGIYKNQERTIARETTVGMIIYSKKGTHIVPLKPKDL